MFMTRTPIALVISEKVNTNLPSVVKLLKSIRLGTECLTDVMI